MSNKYLRLNDISAYKKCYQLSNKIWGVVSKWSYLAKDTIGKQIIRSVDSISANIAEGFGRKFKKDKIRFYLQARGSVFESLDWWQKAKDRRLINTGLYKDIYISLKSLPKEINTLIKFTHERMKD